MTPSYSLQERVAQVHSTKLMISKRIMHTHWDIKNFDLCKISSLGGITTFITKVPVWPMLPRCSLQKGGVLKYKVLGSWLARETNIGIKRGAITSLRSNELGTHGKKQPYQPPPCSRQGNLLIAHSWHEHLTLLEKVSGERACPEMREDWSGTHHLKTCKCNKDSHMQKHEIRSWVTIHLHKQVG